MFLYSTEESNYIFFEKAGNNLLRSVFDSMFSRHSVNFRSDCVIPLDSKEFREEQKFLFVRNL